MQFRLGKSEGQESESSTPSGRVLGLRPEAAYRWLAPPARIDGVEWLKVK
jgi:hypothetical protein